MKARLLIALELVSLTCGAQEPAVHVDLFTDSTHPIAVHAAPPSVHVNYYDLDAAPRFEAMLSEGLPADPVAAERLARERLQSLDVGRYAAALRTAFRGALLAHSYALVKYPAMVFDGRAVIYGVRDLDDAFARYRSWRDERTSP